MRDMTQREARQRAAVYDMGLSHKNGEFRVFFPEFGYDKQERTAYYTTDAEDAALTAGAMRRRESNNAR